MCELTNGKVFVADRDINCYKIGEVCHLENFEERCGGEGIAVNRVVD